MTTLEVVQDTLQRLRDEWERLRQQILGDEARSRQPGFTDWERLGRNRSAAYLIAQAIKNLEKALPSLEQPE